MSRFDGKIGGEGGSRFDAADILAALTAEAETKSRRRQVAVSCYLSASTGWREASTMLGGAFADGIEGQRPRGPRKR